MNVRVHVQFAKQYFASPLNTVSQQEQEQNRRSTNLA